MKYETYKAAMSLLEDYGHLPGLRAEIASVMYHAEEAIKVSAVSLEDSEPTREEINLFVGAMIDANALRYPPREL